MNGQSRDEKLKALYVARWNEFAAAIPTGIGMSAPLLVKVPASYEDCEIKLAIIGQQTNGWEDWQGGNDPADIDRLRATYEKFERGKHYLRTPFFQGAYRLQELLNPQRDRYGFA